MTVLPDQLRHFASTEPATVAYRLAGGGGITFAEWDALASRVARGLVARGVCPGDRVALLFPPTDALSYLAAYVGTHKAGGVNVPLGPELTPGELRRVLDHAEPSVVVASDCHDGAPDVSVAYTALLDADGRDLQARIGDDDMADLLYTSGTTGTPKGVVTRHGNAAHMPVGPRQWNGGTWLHASPLSTSAGVAFVYVPMQLGMTGMYMPRFDPGAFLDLAEDGAFQMAFLVPAMVELLLARDDVERRDLSGLTMITVGSAPIAPASLLRLKSLLPAGIVLNAFALTESGAGQVVLPGDELERRPGSVGRPVPPAEVRIASEDDGEPLPPGDVGEILVRTPGRTREYWRDPELTAATWRDGWLHTGDLGHVDDDGYLYVTGRKKDVIIRGGKNVHAADVEAVLYAHPSVAEAAVVGVPHPVLGEDVAACVVPRPGAEVDGEVLAAHCAGRLPAYKTPRRWLVLDALPRNAMGKVRKDQLRQHLIDRSG